MTKVRYLLVFLFLAGAMSPLSGQALQQNNLSKLMVEKLSHAHRLFEGIATRNFTKITPSAEELIRLSKTAEWYAMRTPRYEVHSNEFRRAAEKIVKKAKEKDLDAVAMSFGELTMSCVRCHDYVREVRDVRLQVPRPDLAALRNPE